MPIHPMPKLRLTELRSASKQEEIDTLILATGTKDTEQQQQQQKVMSLL